MRRLNEEDLPFLALVVGDGSLNRWLFEFVEYEKLHERVRILGTQPLSRVRDLLAAGDIIFLPSENEGISLTLFEGMASGLVPVGADVGGQRELVSPDCGFLLPRGTEEEEADRYARVLMRLIRDPLLRIEMGRASRERVANHFTLDQMGERMEELIRVALRFREESSQKPSTEEMAGLLARQGVEYFRASAEIKRLAKSAGSMPPAPARTYFYFAFRQALYPLIGRFSDKDWLARLKDRVKAVLVRPQS
jgi:hypothetical protein